MDLYSGHVTVQPKLNQIKTGDAYSLNVTLFHLPHIMHIQGSLLLLSKISPFVGNLVISWPKVDLIRFISTIFITFITQNVLLKIIRVRRSEQKISTRKMLRFLLDK